ncbi:MAG: hypothetical protein ABIP94_09915 [Planctomycetota bacterium]
MSPPVDPAILAVVPHRPPMLRVHQIVAANAQEVVVVGQEPTGPGALPWELGAIEGLAQAAAVLLAQTMAEPTAPHGAPRGMLVSVKRFTIDAAPASGAEITYHVRLVRRLGATALVTGHAEVAQHRLAGGELTLWTARAEAPRPPAGQT